LSREPDRHRRRAQSPPQPLPPRRGWTVRRPTPLSRLPAAPRYRATMRPLRLPPALLALLALPAAVAAASSAPLSGSPAPTGPWPELTRENKPWTRWWWPGSAVDPASLTGNSRNSRRRHRRRRNHADLRRQRLRVALPRFPFAAMDGAARTHRPRGAPPWARRRHGHRHRLALRRPVGHPPTPAAPRPQGWPAHRRTDENDGEARRARRRRARDRSVSTAALARYLAPFDRAFANFPARPDPRPVPRLLRVLQRQLDRVCPEVFRAMHGYDIQQYAAAV
jgi:hypothetical protein